MGQHQTDHADHPFYLLCCQSAFMRLLAVAKGTAAGFKWEFFICIKLAHGTHNFDFVEPECILSSADLEMIGFFLAKQSLPRPSRLIYSNAPLAAQNLLICEIKGIKQYSRLWRTLFAFLIRCAKGNFDISSGFSNSFICLIPCSLFQGCSTWTA